MEKFSLSRQFSNGLSDFLDEILTDDVFNNSSFLSTLNLKHTDYVFTDKGDHYELSIDFEDDFDKVTVKGDKEKNRITVTVSGDYSKSNATWTKSYYGQYIVDVPEDCIIEEPFNSERKEGKMIFTFDKKKDYEQKEKESDSSTSEKTETACKCSKENDKYKLLYDKQVEETQRYIDEIDELKKEVRECISQNKELKAKLENIKKLI